MWSHSSGGNSIAPTISRMPAQFTRTSGGPTDLASSAKAPSTDVEDSTSVWMNSVGCGGSFGGTRSMQTRVAPRFPNAWSMPMPKPPAPPVTTTIWPSKFISSCALSRRRSLRAEWPRRRPLHLSGVAHFTAGYNDEASVELAATAEIKGDLYRNGSSLPEPGQRIWSDNLG